MAKKTKKKNSNGMELRRKSPLFAALVTLFVVVAMFLFSILVLVPLADKTSKKEENEKVTYEQERSKNTKHLLNDIMSRLTEVSSLSSLNQVNGNCSSEGPGFNAKWICRVSFSFSSRSIEASTYGLINEKISSSLANDSRVSLELSDQESPNAFGKKFQYTKYPNSDCSASSTLDADGSYFLLVQCRWEASTWFYFDWDY